MICNDNKSTVYPFPEPFELQLTHAFRSLKALGCDYFYFLGLDGGMTNRFCTHEDWIDFYYDEQLILHDPLKRIAENQSFLALPWKQTTHSNKNEKRTMCGRLSFGLFNGLTVTRTHLGKKYIFALATESKEHCLDKYLLLEKVDVLERFVKNCMKTFDHYSLFMAPQNMTVM